MIKSLLFLTIAIITIQAMQDTMHDPLLSFEQAWEKALYRNDQSTDAKKTPKKKVADQFSDVRKLQKKVKVAKKALGMPDRY